MRWECREKPRSAQTKTGLNNLNFYDAFIPESGKDVNFDLSIARYTREI